MFETLRLRDRRSFAVLERLAEQAGTGIVLAGHFEEMPNYLDDVQRAMALAEVGGLALTLVIGTTGKPRSIWKPMTPDTGAKATIYLTHGIAATTARLASVAAHHLDSQRQHEARDLLRATFPWSDEDESRISQRADLINPGTAEGVEQAQVGLAYDAVQMIVGDAAATLPGFAGLNSDDSLNEYTSVMSWSICFNHVTPPYLRLSDPAGMARRECG